MVYKQLYELDPVKLPLKDDDLLLVSLKSDVEKTNFSRKATVSNVASKIKENVATQIDNAKYLIQLECDNKYANKNDVYTRIDVDALIAMVNPSINYITRSEVAETYTDKYTYNLQVLLINSSLEEKLTLANADIRYAFKDASYSKAVIDSKIDALYDDFPKKDEVCTLADVDAKIEELQDIYIAKDNVYTTAETNTVLSSLSSTLTSMIDDVSPFRIKSFTNDNTLITIENGAINTIGKYETNQLSIVLPAYDENKLIEFYVIVDNSLHNSNVQLNIVLQNGTKIFSANEQCFADVPAWKICYLHFKQISTEYVLKVDRSDLAVIISSSNLTESEQQDNGAENSD